MKINSWYKEVIYYGESYEGTLTYVFLLLILSVLIISSGVLLVNSLFYIGNLDILSTIFIYLLGILTFGFLVKLFQYTFRTAFYDKKEFYLTDKAIHFSQLFKDDRIVLLDDIKSIALNTTIDLEFLFFQQPRTAIVLTLNDGSTEFILKHRGYVNLRKFIILLKRKFPDKIIE